MKHLFQTKIDEGLKMKLITIFLAVRAEGMLSILSRVLGYIKFMRSSDGDTPFM